MLVLTRLDGEEIVITCADGKRLIVHVCEAHPGRVSLGFQTEHREIIIDRREVDERKAAGIEHKPC